MVESSGLNNRVYQMLSQKSSKAAVDVLGMRLSTNYKGKFTAKYGAHTTHYYFRKVEVWPGIKQ